MKSVVLLSKYLLMCMVSRYLLGTYLGRYTIPRRYIPKYMYMYFYQVSTYLVYGIWCSEHSMA